MAKKTTLPEHLWAELVNRHKAGDSLRALSQWLRNTHKIFVSPDGSTVSRWLSARSQEDTTVSQALADSEAARARLVTVQVASAETLGDLGGLAAVIDGLAKDAETLSETARLLRDGAHWEEDTPKGRARKFDLRRLAEARRHTEAAISARGTAAQVLRARIVLAQGAQPAQAQEGPRIGYYAPRGEEDPHALVKRMNEPAHADGTQ